jgi:hypothetical protein
VIQQRYRRLLADPPMRAFFVVVLAPILHLFSRVRKRQKPMRVQTFNAEATIERFDECIVGGLSRSGKVERDTTLIRPQI